MRLRGRSWRPWFGKESDRHTSRSAERVRHVCGGRSSRVGPRAALCAALVRPAVPVKFGRWALGVDLRRARKFLVLRRAGHAAQTLGAPAIHVVVRTLGERVGPERAALSRVHFSRCRVEHSSGTDGSRRSCRTPASTAIIPAKPRNRGGSGEAHSRMLGSTSALRIVWCVPFRQPLRLIGAQKLGSCKHRPLRRPLRTLRAPREMVASRRVAGPQVACCDCVVDASRCRCSLYCLLTLLLAVSLLWNMGLHNLLRRGEFGEPGAGWGMGDYDGDSTSALVVRCHTAPAAWRQPAVGVAGWGSGEPPLSGAGRGTGAGRARDEPGQDALPEPRFAVEETAGVA
jgi:hypothetical protein